MSHPTGDEPSPGLGNQLAVRNTLRVVGPVLLVGGLVAIVWSFVALIGASSDFADPGAGLFLLFLGGGFSMVVGLAMTGAGYQGAVTRFGAGEQAPVLKDTASYLSDGEGVLGVGRTRPKGTGDAAETGAGPYCRRCGTRNDADARFCDSCGESMA